MDDVGPNGSDMPSNGQQRANSQTPRHIEKHGLDSRCT
jgi:hypothetical protein